MQEPSSVKLKEGTFQIVGTLSKPENPRPTFAVETYSVSTGGLLGVDRQTEDSPSAPTSYSVSLLCFSSPLFCGGAGGGDDEGRGCRGAGRRGLGWGADGERTFSSDGGDRCGLHFTCLPEGQNLHAMFLERTHLL